jgi:hypothetical protein
MALSLNVRAFEVHHVGSQGHRFHSNMPLLQLFPPELIGGLRLMGGHRRCLVRRQISHVALVD